MSKRQDDLCFVEGEGVEARDLGEKRLRGRFVARGETLRLEEDLVDPFEVRVAEVCGLAFLDQAGDEVVQGGLLRVTRSELNECQQNNSKFSRKSQCVVHWVRMLTNAQEKLIKRLATKKGREKEGLCLVEGENALSLAKDFLEFSFTRAETERFDQLVTTETPQAIAGVARIPSFSLEEVDLARDILVLDNIQDPGNVGALFRLGLAFGASLLLIESVDPTNPKVIRSSTGAVFAVPHALIKRSDVEGLFAQMDRQIIRVEKRQGAKDAREMTREKSLIVFGSEGRGIQLETEGASYFIPHDEKLESLNVATAASIILWERYR